MDIVVNIEYLAVVVVEVDSCEGDIVEWLDY